MKNKGKYITQSSFIQFFVVQVKALISSLR